MTDLNRLAGVFAALANEHRLAIIEELRAHRGSNPATPDASLNVSEIAQRTELTRFSASHHLGVLRESGVLTAYRTSREMRHSVNEETLEEVEDWLLALLDDPLVPAVRAI
jgi:DNA-binding transcriptional ArsR family regulator